MKLVPQILFEDSSLMVVDKPAGMVVNRAESVEEPAVQGWVEKTYAVWSMQYAGNTDDSSSVFRQRSGISHRLDKETSGCLLIAKNPVALQELMRQFKERLISKKYIALVHGKLEPREGGWRLPITRNGKNRTEFIVNPFGKIAETSYQVETYYQGFTLVNLYPKTGRTHQLRVHCLHMKHPIVSDEKYLTDSLYRDDGSWCPRLFLHAREISFKHPVKQIPVTVEAPLPSVLEKVLQGLRVI